MQNLRLRRSCSSRHQTDKHTTFYSINRNTTLLRGKTYLAELPDGYEGDLDLGIKALVISLYYGSNMTQKQIPRIFWDIGISMSAGYLSNLLIKNHETFILRKVKSGEGILKAVTLAALDQTTARVKWGVNYNN